MNVAQKLKVKAGDGLLVLNAPPGFKNALGALPEGARIVADGKPHRQIHWFVKSRAQMEREIDGVLARLVPDETLWIYYPKGSSKIETDLTRDKGWDSLRSNERLQWLTLISFDEDWSAFACRWKSDDGTKKAAKKSEAKTADPAGAYVDRTARTVTPPEDLAAALAKDKKARTFFESLSFTCRREYVEWIVSAKREQTRTDRVAGTMERLAKGWKNPRNM